MISRQRRRGRGKPLSASIRNLPPPAAIAHIMASFTHRLLVLFPFFVAGFLAGLFDVQPVILASSVLTRLKLGNVHQQHKSQSKVLLATSFPAASSSDRLPHAKVVLPAAPQSEKSTNAAQPCASHAVAAAATQHGATAASAAMTSADAGQSVLLSDAQRAQQTHPVLAAPLPLAGQQSCDSLRDWVTPLCRGATAATKALRGGRWLHEQCCRGVDLMSAQGCFW